MTNYVEFHEGDEPKREEVKSDGSYVEPTRSDESKEETLGENAPDEATERPSERNAIGGVFVLNEGGFKPPKTLVFVGVLVGLVAVFVLSKVWEREAELARFVVQGNRLQKTEEIERVASKFIGKKMSDVSLSDIVDSILTLPYVRRAIATKELPDAIRVRIEERQPVAMARIGDDLKLIDEAGYAMNKSGAMSETGRLPLLSGFSKVERDSATGLAKLNGAEAETALAFCKALRETRFARLVVSEVRVVSASQLQAFAASGEAKFLFAKGDYERQLERFEAFWKQVIVKRGVKPFEYVDVRFDGKIFAKETEPMAPKRKSQN